METAGHLKKKSNSALFNISPETVTYKSEYTYLGFM